MHGRDQKRISIGDAIVTSNMIKKQWLVETVQLQCEIDLLKKYELCSDENKQQSYIYVAAHEFNGWEH